MLTSEQRVYEYRKLKARIPIEVESRGRQRGQQGQVIQWLIDNLHVSRSTAKIWNMKNPTRPIPEMMLKFMAEKLEQAGR